MENKNSNHGEKVLKVAIAGLGAIGRVLAKRLDAGDVERCKLVAVSGRDPIKTQSFIETLNCVVPNVALNRLGALADVVIECADRKSTRLNSSHVAIPYAVFCLKKTI